MLPVAHTVPAQIDVRFGNAMSWDCTHQTPESSDDLQAVSLKKSPKLKLLLFTCFGMLLVQ